MPITLRSSVAARDVHGKAASLDRPDLEPVDRAAVGHGGAVGGVDHHAEAAVRLDAGVVRRWRGSSVVTVAPLSTRKRTAWPLTSPLI